MFYIELCLTLYILEEPVCLHVSVSVMSSKNSLSLCQEAAMDNSSGASNKLVKTIFPLFNFIALILNDTLAQAEECLQDPSSPASHRPALLQQTPQSPVCLL